MILKINVNDGDMSRSTYQIAMADQGSGDCDIAEIIGYQTALSPSDEELVGGYLAAKYGIKTDYPANVGMTSANGLTNAPATVSADDAATLSPHVVHARNPHSGADANGQRLRRRPG